MSDTIKKERYPRVDPNPDFSRLELDVLKFWKEHHIFEKSIRGDIEFIFYDGPPFANGLPHYGHLLTGFAKDTYARYQAMLGKKVIRRFGWDCHGLPSEMLTEKELGISGRVAIEEYGIDKFNDYCRTSILRYTKEWKEYIERQARWVDFERDYKTMDNQYMESVLWAFSELYKKGLIYKSMRVMPYSWACETPVSDFETRMDDAYRSKKSKSLTVGFRLSRVPDFVPNDVKEVLMVIWTTTPWTLPSNLALAVGMEIEYSVLRKNDICYVVASVLAHKLEDIIGNNCIAKVLGQKFIGLSYNPPFDYFLGHNSAFVILHGDFVSTEDGTGIVHLAPGFGEDDYILCKENRIALVCPVDSGAKFIYPVKDYIGLRVFDAEDDIIRRLKDLGLWLKTEQYLHDYPHCWRTDTPLIYKAVDSWYLSVTTIRDKMIKNNQQINWIPEHIKNKLFGNWLENARDWSISRNRYWGCPIPVWQSDNPAYPCTEVYASVEELERAFNVKINDLHRPFIDTLVRPNPKDPTGRSMMRRVPEILDCWFESGSMPYAHIHYPFESRKWFDAHFPADFIVEYLAQTRGWFYTLLVLSTALFDRPPFMNCICHGVILGDGGQKLSKRLKNYADPKDVFEKFGADAMRWYMMSSIVMKGQSLVIDRDATGVRGALRLVIKPLWNAYNFFTLYANIDAVDAKFSLDAKNLLDRYIIAKCLSMINFVRQGLDAYDSILSTRAVEEFIEILNNWYIRRSRERFWRSVIDEDKQEAYNTLYSVLRLLCTAIAPLLPMITEVIYRGLTQNSSCKQESVHLESFPMHHNVSSDEKLISDMERVRCACNAALCVRNNAKIRIRQPLSNVTFVGVTISSLSDELLQLVLNEVNVKHWTNLPADDVEKFANYKLALNLSILGRRLPEMVQQIIAAVQRSEWSYEKKTKTVIVLGHSLVAEEFTLKLEPKGEYIKNACALSTDDAIVILDLNLSKELIEEGIARDVVRTIQQIRKDAALDIMERIDVFICAQDSVVEESISSFIWKNYIIEQTLTHSLQSALLEVGEEDSYCAKLKKQSFIGQGEFYTNDNKNSTKVSILVFEKATLLSRNEKIIKKRSSI